MHERTNIRLSGAERSALEAVVANRNSPQKHVWRAKIVLMTADAHGTADIMRLLRAAEEFELSGWSGEDCGSSAQALVPLSRKSVGEQRWF